MTQQRRTQPLAQLQRRVAAQIDGRQRLPGEMTRRGRQSESAAARQSDQRRLVAAAHDELQLDGGQTAEGRDGDSGGGGGGGGLTGRGECADRGRSALTGLGLNVCELSIAGALALVRAAVRIPTLRTLSLTCILYMAITDLDVANKAEIVAKCAGRPRLRLML